MHGRAGLVSSTVESTLDYKSVVMMASVARIMVQPAQAVGNTCTHTNILKPPVLKEED